MTLELPAYVTRELSDGEMLISYIPEPDLIARRRIILALFPLFVVLVIILVWSFVDRASVIGSAAAVYCLIALPIFALRLCRTSYIISERRVVRLVAGKKAHDIAFAESRMPVLCVFSASAFFFARWIARFVSVDQIVKINRVRFKLLSFTDFFTSRDPSEIRIGYPGHSLPIAKIFDDVTVAWEAAQDQPEAALS